MSNASHDLLQRRLNIVEDAVQSACDRSGRKREDVTIIAVTKTVSPEIAAMLPHFGVVDLGESRPQELWRKAESLPSEIRWHQIGHLQTNKIERTLPVVAMIHSIDRSRLLLALDKEAARQGHTVNALLQINASREPQKHGFSPEELPNVIEQLNTIRHVHVRGLMGMAAYHDDPKLCRPTFRLLRELRDEWRDSVRHPHSLEHLSMGMSNDYRIAVEEGATMIRVGSVLFEGME